MLKVIHAPETAPEARESIRKSGGEFVYSIFVTFLIIVAAVTLYLGYMKSVPDDLQGIWRDSNNPSHTYEFRPDGKVASWVNDISMGDLGRWTISDNTVKVRSTDTWHFERTKSGDRMEGRSIDRWTGQDLGSCAWVRN